MMRERFAEIMQRMEKACNKSGRKAGEVQVLAVTKTVPVAEILNAVNLGVHQLGESRVQEAQDKLASLLRMQEVNSCFAPQSVSWHMIGHLQTNKVNRAVEIFDMIQSLDSLKLAKAIERRASELGKVQDCLVELKISEETGKYGVEPPEFEKFMESCSFFKNIRILGLMCMAPYFEDSSQTVRPYFARAYEFFRRFFKDRERAILSMGMSSDFEVAIEEGSTMVRIGSALFGPRPAAA